MIKHSCQSNDKWAWPRQCDVTQRSARFEKDIKILVDLQKHGGFYHYRVVVYMHFSSNN